MILGISHGKICPQYPPNVLSFVYINQVRFLIIFCSSVFYLYYLLLLNKIYHVNNRLNVRASFYIPENRINFTKTKGFGMIISIKLVYQYMSIFFNFSPTSGHFHPLQVENCDSNSRLAVDNVDYGKFRPEKVKCIYIEVYLKTCSLNKTNPCVYYYVNICTYP